MTTSPAADPEAEGLPSERVTLTGGEHTIHPRFTGSSGPCVARGMQVGFCTNATTLTDAQISELARIGGVHANVSLDGFRAESHGRFRGHRPPGHAPGGPAHGLSSGRPDRETRRTATLDDCSLCIDEVEGVGEFLELERMAPDHADAQTIQADLATFVRSLGIAATRTDQTYDNSLVHAAQE